MNLPDFTLSAGPTVVWPRVLAALGSPITYHYDPDFLDGFRRTERKVAELFLTKNDVLLMQGEAVLGLEAAARSLVRPGMPVLNLVSGVFGKGMSYWLKDFGAEVHELEVAYNDSVDPADVERYLDEHAEIELVALVHSETPSGTMHDLAAIGPMARAHDALTLVDCVSSLGGIEYRNDEWEVDISVAAAQKCLGGPPGISLMAVSDRAWERIQANPSAPRASSLSMLDWKEQWLENGKFPFTPSVSEMHGIEACCDEMLEWGLDAAIAQHDLAARSCRAGVKAMGLDLWPRSEEITAACVTAIAVPDGLTDTQVRDHCRERYGVMISSGQGAGNLVRIGHMGPTARSLWPVVGLGALGRTLADLGVSVDVGAGLETALEVLSAREAAVEPAA
ncbi:MAG TPA: alanine--glyoxylate aminotransferase family protein [Gaiellaceae bacterium]|nr:alanine--glyoxylate aminotransferase family protein [Gaiellaceae bacterium]